MIGTLVKIRDFCSFWYLQYTLITSLYMLEPLERIVFNTLLVVITAMFIYTSFYFMQPYMFSFVNYLTKRSSEFIPL